MRYTYCHCFAVLFFRDVNELNEEHLNFMVRNSEQYLRDIFEGKVSNCI